MLLLQNRKVSMVDVSEKKIMFRRAKAIGRIRLSKGTLEKILAGKIEKGDAITIAKIAAINAAKEASKLIPMCHPLKITHVDADIRPYENGLEVSVEVKVIDRTGPDMEAITACAVALLNIFDMVKAYEKDENGLYPEMQIEWIKIVEKEKREIQ